MHPELLKHTVQACRDQIAGGDSPGPVDNIPAERLMFAVAQLADEVDRLHAEVAPSASEAVAWVSHTASGQPLIPTFDRAVAESWKAKGGDVRPLVYGNGAT